MGDGPSQGDLGSQPDLKMALPIHHIATRRDDGRFTAGLVPVHSQLLEESLLVSFPPLSYMLKFSG